MFAVKGGAYVSLLPPGVLVDLVASDPIHLLSCAVSLYPMVPMLDLGHLHTLVLALDPRQAGGLQRHNHNRCM